MSRRFAALVLVGLMVAACGGSSASPSGSPKASAGASAGASGSLEPSESAGASESAAPSASPSGPVQLIACAPGGPGFPVSRLDSAADAESGTTAAAKALVEYLGGDGKDLPQTGWRELYRSKETALYGQDDPSGQAGVLVVVTVSNTGGTWAGEDNAQCKPQTWLGSTLGEAATWKLAAKTSKTSKTLKVVVSEKACAGGASPKGRIAKPRITYADDQVVVTIGVTPLQGEQDCKSAPAAPLTVTLSEALGTRQLFDGGPYPAVQVAQPK